MTGVDKLWVYVSIIIIFITKLVWICTHLVRPLHMSVYKVRYHTDFETTILEIKDGKIKDNEEFFIKRMI